jgi:flagellar hook-length control protein FliK
VPSAASEVSSSLALPSPSRLRQPANAPDGGGFASLLDAAEPPADHDPQPLEQVDRQIASEDAPAHPARGDEAPRTTATSKETKTAPGEPDSRDSGADEAPLNTALSKATKTAPGEPDSGDSADAKAETDNTAPTQPAPVTADLVAPAVVGVGAKEGKAKEESSDVADAMRAAAMAPTQPAGPVPLPIPPLLVSQPAVTAVPEPGLDAVAPIDAGAAAVAIVPTPAAPAAEVSVAGVAPEQNADAEGPSQAILSAEKASQPQDNETAQAAKAPATDARDKPADAGILRENAGQKVATDKPIAPHTESAGRPAIQAAAATPAEARPPGDQPHNSAVKSGADLLPSFGFSVPNAAATAAVPHAGSALPAVPIAGLAVEIVARSRAGVNRFEIRLDPPELGRIDVRLEVARDGRVMSHVTVERSETLHLLQREQPQLERALEQAGLKTADNGLQFSLRDQSFAGREDSGRQTPSRVIIPDAEAAPTEMAQSYGRLPGPGGVDIRV